MLQYIEDNDVVTWHNLADKNLREVLAKYRKMQKALGEIKLVARPEPKAERECLRSYLSECARLADDALSFDPLPPS